MARARGRYQQVQWEQREEAILDALQALSAERGFSAVTMDALAEAVGISKATLYQHFDSKDALLAALLAQQIDRFGAWLADAAGRPPVEQLCHAMSALMGGHFTPLRGLVSVGRDEALPVFYNSPALVQRHEQILAALTAIIRQGQADGSIAPDLDPFVVISAMLALSSVSPGESSGSGYREAVAAHPGYADQMLALFERAIRPTWPRLRPSAESTPQ
ncbi:MAG: TetR/AcrR family transcriptional regulator [Anaerolineae bacterium]|nr:TetR/AcrR family transcriptional regulator [Anaerolineae bacterium]